MNIYLKKNNEKKKKKKRESQPNTFIIRYQSIALCQRWKATRIGRKEKKAEAEIEFCYAWSIPKRDS